MIGYRVSGLYQRICRHLDFGFCRFVVGYMGRDSGPILEFSLGFYYGYFVHGFERTICYVLSLRIQAYSDSQNFLSVNLNLLSYAYHIVILQ